MWRGGNVKDRKRPTCILPASMREKSRIVFTRRSNLMPLRCTMVRRSRCAGGRGQSVSASESSRGPMMSVSGVLGWKERKREGNKNEYGVCCRFLNIYAYDHMYAYVVLIWVGMRVMYLNSWLTLLKNIVFERSSSASISARFFSSCNAVAEPIAFPTCPATSSK